MGVTGVVGGGVTAGGPGCGLTVFGAADCEFDVAFAWASDSPPALEWEFPPEFDCASDCPAAFPGGFD